MVFISSISRSPGLPGLENSENNAIDITLRAPTGRDYIQAYQSVPNKEVDSLSEIVIEDLSSERVDALLSRVKALNEQVEQSDFHMREKSIKPPNAYKEIEVEFPPKENIELPEEIVKDLELESQKNLLVLRYSPEGELTHLAGRITITFSQPMCPITSIDQLNTLDVPVELSPMPEGGRWVWLGTKTLAFEPNPRMNYSTTYTVSMKSGTKSMSGGVLENDFSFTFTTPLPEIRRSYPTGTHQNIEKQIGFIEFNQRIDPVEVIKFIKVNNKEEKVTLLSHAEVDQRLMLDLDLEKKFPSVVRKLRQYLQTAIPKQHLFFSINDTFDKSQIVQISVLSGMPSAEGPLVTDSEESYSFTTIPLFTIKNSNGGKSPYSHWHITLSNSIDEESFDLDTFVNITPKVSHKLQVSGSTITIMPESSGNTLYTVALSENIKDIYGQNLTSKRECTFQVGFATSTFRQLQPSFFTWDHTLSQNEVPELDFLTVNIPKLNIEVFQVHPYQFSTVRYYFTTHGNMHMCANIENVVKSFKKVASTTITTEERSSDTPIASKFQLHNYLQHPRSLLGHLLVYVKASDYLSLTWVQCTKLALDAFFVPGENIYAWVNSLEDGSPVLDAKVGLGKQNLVSTDELGMVRIEGGNSSELLIATSGDDITLNSCLLSYYYNANIEKYRVQIFDDRGLYRPKEAVNFKGFIRSVVKNGPFFSMKIPESSQLKWKLRDSSYSEYLSGTCDTNSWGSFHISIESIPDIVNLGSHVLEVTLDSYSFHHSFSVQEFRTPEFKCSVSVPSNNYVVGSSTIAKVHASYYSGGPLSGAKGSWNVSQAYTMYVPPNFGEFSFNNDFVSINDQKSIELQTNDSGEGEIAIQFDENSRPHKLPVQIFTACNVQDMNFQTISSSTSFTVHPSSLYVGIKLLKNYISQNQPLTYNLVVCDIDGNEKKNIDVIVTVRRLATVRRGCKYVTKKIVTHEEVVQFTSSDEIHTILINEGGKYDITVKIEDSHGRPNEAKTGLYVFGGTSNLATRDTRITEQYINLIANQNTYRSGETAKILVQSPLRQSSEGVMVVTYQGIVSIEKFQLDSQGNQVLDVPIKDEFVPNVNVAVYIIGKDTRIGPDGQPIVDSNVPLRPGYAKGTIQLMVSLYKHELLTSLDVDEVVKPGSNIPIGVRVLDFKEEPVKDAEVTLVVVDEAILSLTGYSISKPISLIQYVYSNLMFHSTRQDVYVREISTEPFQELVPPCPPPASSPQFSLMSKSRVPMKRMAFSAFSNSAGVTEAQLTGADASSASNEVDNRIEVRSNILPIAAFIPNLVTDKDGQVQATIQLPDNLTQYRVTAVVVHNSDRFGFVEKKIQVQIPLSVRPSIPRFLNFGDRNVQFSVVLQNQVGSDIQVEVATKMNNLEIASGTGGYLVSIPAGKRAKVLFNANTLFAGEANFHVVASIVSGKYSDAVTEKINVYTPATTEAFATYGEIDDGAISQVITPPPNVFPQFGGIQISTSSTAIGSLIDSFLYLVNYQYLCSEQIASRIIAIVSLYDILQQFKVPKLPKPSAVKANLTSALEKLSSIQKVNGAFGFWESSTNISHYNSIHVAHALVRCVNAGKSVPNNLYKKTITFISDMKSRLASEKYSETTKLTLRAYAVYVLSQMNEKKFRVTNQTIAEEALQIYETSEQTLEPEAQAWICSALRISLGSQSEVGSKILKDLSNRFNESTRTANFISSFSDPGEGKMILLHSSTKTDAIILDMLLTVDKTNSIIPKFVRGLENRRKNGIFRNTQENIFSLIALRKYFEMFESVTPDFVSRSWLENDYIAETHHQGRNTEVQNVNIPMTHLLKNGVSNSQKLIMQKEGLGRMYYRLGMNYAPKDLDLKAVSYGFTVRRKYRGVKSDAHVKQLEDGTWIFAVGELIEVKISFSIDSKRYHVALVDKLPAGLEVVNPDLNGQELSKSKKAKRGVWYWWRRWFEHQNLRTERVEAFSELVWEGTHEFNYTCRATACGDFVIPPCQVEEMYSPELFGRTGYEKVRVEHMK